MDRTLLQISDEPQYLFVLVACAPCSLLWWLSVWAYGQIIIFSGSQCICCADVIVSYFSVAILVHWWTNVLAVTWVKFMTK
jgi:hypothetical protein